MARRIPVRPIGPYDVRTLLATVAHLPDRERWVRQVGSPRPVDTPVLNPLQPVVPPSLGQCQNALLYALPVPVEIAFRANGRLATPASLDRLEWALDLQSWKISLFLSEFGVTTHAEINAKEASDKAGSRALQGLRAQGMSLMPADFRAECQKSAAAMFPLDRRAAPRRFDVCWLGGRPRHWFERQRSILHTLATAVLHHQELHRGFAGIMLRAKRDHQLLSLGGLHQAYARLPRSVALEHLLDTAFHGLINPATIYADRAALADLLALAAALGLANLGLIRMRPAIARAYLSGVMGEGEPPLDVPQQFRAERAALARMIIERYGLAPCVETIAEVCREVEARDEEFEANERLWPLL